jgi:hypothetical protein
MIQRRFKENERLRRFRKNNPDKWRQYQKNWNNKNRRKYLAHKKVENAIKSGELLTQSCFCGAKAHAHHDDYSKPLEVLWLCPQHHKDRHRELVKLGIDPDIKE